VTQANSLPPKMLFLTTRIHLIPPILTASIFYSSDQSKYVRNRLKIVTNNGIIGLLLVLVVLGVFLSLKTAFWVAVSLPVSLLGSVALLGTDQKNKRFVFVGIFPLAMVLVFS
jgi:Cu/Ag efflux pump CusA